MKSFLARRHQIQPPALRPNVVSLRTTPTQTAFIRSITKIKPEKHVKRAGHRMVKEYQNKLVQKEIHHAQKTQRWLKAADQLAKPVVIPQRDPFTQNLKELLMQSSEQNGLVDAEKEPDTEEEKAHKKTHIAAKIIDADPKKAMQFFNEALAVDPELVPALLGRGAVHEINEEIDRAYADYKKLSEVLHKKFNDPSLPYRYRYEDPVLKEVESRLIMMDLEKGKVEAANSRLFQLLEHAPDPELWHLATAINGNIARLFHDEGNRGDHYYRDIVRSLPVVIRWSDRGRGLYPIRQISAGETIWLEKPLVSVSHNVKKSISACHFCGKLENDVAISEPDISTVPPQVMELLQQPTKMSRPHNVSSEDLEKWDKIATLEMKNPKKDPEFLTEFDFRLRLRENMSNFEMFAESLRQNAGVDDFNLMRDSNGRTFCCKQCKEAAHQIYGSIDNHPSYTKMERLASRYDSYTGLLLARIFATYQWQMKNHITPTIMDHLLRMTHPLNPEAAILSDGEKEELNTLLEIFPDETTRKYLEPRTFFQLKSIILFNSFDLPSQALSVSVPKEFGGDNSSVNITYEHKLSNTTMLAVASYLQHSCDPNVVPRPVLNGTKEVGIMATRDIDLNEALTWSYVDETLPTAERRKILSEKFFIDCKCPRCYAELASQSPTMTILREKQERETKQLEEEIRATIRKDMEERRRRRKDRVVDAEHTGPFFSPANESPQEELVFAEESGLQEAPQTETVVTEESVQLVITEQFVVPEKVEEEKVFVFDEAESLVFEESPGEITSSYTEEAVIVDTRNPEVAELITEEDPLDDLRKENEEMQKEVQRLRLLAENEKLKKELEALRASLRVAPEPPKAEQPAKVTQAPPQAKATTQTPAQAKVTQAPPPVKVTPTPAQAKVAPPTKTPPTKARTPTPQEISPFEEEEILVGNYQAMEYPASLDEQSFLEEEEKADDSGVPLWKDFEPNPQPSESKPSFDIKAEESLFGEEEMVQSEPAEGLAIFENETPTDPMEMLEKMNFSENVLRLVREKLEAEKQKRDKMLKDSGIMDLIEDEDAGKKDIL